MRVGKFIFFIVITACTVRESNPVAISQPGDSRLSCAQIRSQVTQNNSIVESLAEKDRSIKLQNDFALGLSILVLPAVFAVDGSKVEQIELRALVDRNKNLKRIFGNKSCPA